MEVATYVSNFSPPASSSDWLDRHLARICRVLELTPTQYQEAKERYEAVGRWLSEASSPLSPFEPSIYPQGSMRLGTTIRPWRGEEYDLDLVCQLHRCAQQGPLAIYNSVRNRLWDNGTYRPMLEGLKRCLRLNYRGQFHLDILPACPVLSGADKSIVVPDRKLQCWTVSNPMGFADWFFDRCKLQDELGKRILRAEVQPLPPAVHSEQKYPLQRVVQLMKRHRDLFFDGGRDIARSVILTTLAAQSYHGQQSLSTALYAIIEEIHAGLATAYTVPRIPNPVNPQENFADTWDMEAFTRFKSYIRNFRNNLTAVLALPTEEQRGLVKMSESLGSAFGRPIVNEAIRLEASEINRARVGGLLAVSSAGTLVSSQASSTRIQQNHFFGK